MNKFIQKFEISQGVVNSKFVIKNVLKEKNQCNPHWHDHYEIIFVKSKGTKLTTINTVTPLEQYSIVLIPPFIIHDTICEEDFTEVTVLSLSSVFYSQIFNGTDNAIASFLDNVAISLTPTVGVVSAHKYAERIFKNVKKEYADYSHASDVIVQGNLLILFGLMYKNQKLALPGNNYVNDEFFDSAEVKKYIAENFNCKLSLTDVAMHFNYSPTYFSKIFKRNIGISFNDYTNSLKIKKAQELLFLQNKSITEVAALLNYEATQNFCRIYKQKTGFSPYQHKNNYTINVASFSSDEKKS